MRHFINTRDKPMKYHIALSLILLTLAPSLAAAADNSAQSQWLDSLGRSGFFNLNGDQLSGELFGDFTGTVSSTAEGVLYVAWWDDSLDANECGPGNAYSGPMKLLFNTAGTSFTGSFGYCRENTTHDSLSVTGNYSGTLQGGSLNFSQLTGNGEGGNTSVPTDVAPISSSLNWSNTLSAGFTWSTPIVLDDRVILQDQDGGFDAFKLSDGSRLYNSKLVNAFPTNSPIYANGFVYFIANGLIKVDPENGSQHGSYTADSITSQSPAAYNDLVIVGGSSTVYGIDVNAMTPRWSNNLNSSGNIDVAISEDILYVFADKLYALDPVTGNEYWNVAPPENKGVFIGAVGAGYLSVFENDFSSTQLHTYKLNANRKSAPTLFWSADMGANSADRTPPAIDGNLVFATSRVGVLKAFELSGNGAPLWEKTVRGSGSASALPIAVNGVVILQEEASPNAFQLVGYNGQSGTEVFRTNISAMSVSWGEPTIKNGVVYFATDGTGTLYAVAVPGLVGEWAMMRGNAQLSGSSVSGLVSELDASSLTIDLPQLYVPGTGVFSTELTLADANTLKFILNADNVTAVNVSSSSISTYDAATQEINIPRLLYKGDFFNVTFLLTGSSGNNLEFTFADAR